MLVLSLPLPLFPHSLETERGLPEMNTQYQIKSEGGLKAIIQSVTPVTLVSKA